ncbi:MAG: hypothetical protein ABSA09_11735 [Desulfobaccales bacterium]
MLIGLSVILLLGMAGWGVLKSQAFWLWGGWELVNLARDRLDRELQRAANCKFADNSLFRSYRPFLLVCR